MAEKTLFADEVGAVERAVTWITNADFTPLANDPRNLDPDDEPLVEMMSAAHDLQEAADALGEAVKDEMRARSAKLDELDETEYDEWEKTVA